MNDNAADSGHEPSKHSSFREGLWVGVLLSGISVVVATIWLGPSVSWSYKALLPPWLTCMAGGAAFLLLGSSYPSLLYRERSGFPMAAIAPLLHSSLLALITALGTTAPTGIERAPDPLQPALLWLNPASLAVSAASQCILLWIVAWRLPRR